MEHKVNIVNPSRAPEAGSGSSIFVVRPFRVNNYPLDAVNQFQRSAIAVLQRLRGLAPAAIENGVGGRDARGRRRILAPHDADENADCGSCVAARERASFNKGLGHAGFLASLASVCIYIRVRDDGIGHRRAESNRWKVGLRVAIGRRNQLNDFAHESSSDTAMTTRPMSASDIRQAVIEISKESCGMVAVRAQTIWGANLIPLGAACGGGDDPSPQAGAFARAGQSLW